MRVAAAERKEGKEGVDGGEEKKGDERFWELER